MKFHIYLCVFTVTISRNATSLPSSVHQFNTADYSSEKVLRNKRAITSPLVYDLVVVKGIRAARQLLEGAKAVSTYGRTRKYEKIGKSYDAFMDFFAVHPDNIRNFRAADGSLGKVGRVGDRQITVTSRGSDGYPAIEIRQIEATLQPAEISKDIILYKKPKSL